MIGPENGAFEEKFHAIQREVVQLHLKWRYFIQLFGQLNRIAVINLTAPAIFSSIEDAMLADILLTLMRLVDPAKSFKNKNNLCFMSLVCEIKDDVLKKQIELLVEDLRDTTKAMKMWRDKKLAHNDLDRCLKLTEILPEIRVQQIIDSLALTEKIVNLLNGHFFDTSVRCEPYTEKDGDSLLFYLRYGMECWNEDKAKHDLSRIRKWKEQGMDIMP